MLLLISVFVACVLWVALWGLGMKGFDAFMLCLLFPLAAATIQVLTPRLRRGSDTSD